MSQLYVVSLLYLLRVLQNGDESGGSEEEDAVDNNAIPGTPPSKKVCVFYGFFSRCSRFVITELNWLG